MTAQGYAVELYFDPALENQVLKAWNVLARRQITKHLIDMQSRPHITLLSSPSLDPHRLLSSLRSLASRHEPFPLSLSAAAAFPGDPAVLFLSPTPSLSLLSLHSQLCDALRKESFDAPDEFRVDSWVPHCSVAQDVAGTRVAEAFCILRDLKLPVTGYVTELGVVEFSPVREIFSFPLGSLSES
ncbi:Cyclic phosphodiesterase protein [Dioscorea alata]|uniref:Uncharacterized protein LOC120266609 n=3 Tax=Dioscorea TaxID=4672 RepID=A0AB40BUT1_DIOCR|nr:uncharacterized protein LOC120266609 [Dioscorea cayenensis subsp. rotundata]KAH7674472.1 Cyclic phosphodiesterase protein [Dioscorea alata]KAH7674473.1 Cyclic phosphodiesterase protein [Dioscorea alata]